MGHIIKEQLCACNNCNSIMVDMNADNQPELKIDSDFIKEMVLANDEGEEQYPHYSFWACPVCLSDAWLTDITSEKHLLTFIPQTA